MCIPLIVYAYIRGIKKRTIFFVFGIPAIIFILYAAWIITKYDLQGFLMAFSGCMDTNNELMLGQLTFKWLDSFTFLGGSTFPIAFLLQLITARKKHYIYWQSF